MTFTEFIDQAWTDHATHSHEVAKRFPQALALVRTPDQIPPLAGLITHVMGEHLMQWEAGVELLQGLRNLAGDDPSIVRSIAVLKLGLGQREGFDKLTTSDRVRVLATAASATQSSELFYEALAQAPQLEKSDPAIRALAVAGNNLACSLEETKDRSPQQDQMMLTAAKSAREYWAQAGGWLEVGRAEYRLAMTCIQLQDFSQAQIHAQNYLDLCEANGAAEDELKYAREALSLAKP